MKLAVIVYFVSYGLLRYFSGYLQISGRLIYLKSYFVSITQYCGFLNYVRVFL